LRILVLSPYQAHSHRVWIEQLMAGLPEFQWQVLTLPARHFTWRIRSNPLSWYLGGALDRVDVPDVILATSMTDLATLKGVYARRLGGVPSIVYFHENQFAYPLAPGATASVEPAMVNLYSALAADRVVFNSNYNRRTFFDRAQRFLSRMPDRLSVEGLADIEAASSVIPVPVQDRYFEQPRSTPPPGRLVWNHRWEYDKGPERLLAAVSWLADEGVDFTLELAGQRFRRVPEALDELTRRFGGRVRDHGRVEHADYPSFLAGGGIVLSTALHDFQGLAVQEAAAAGCVPMVPDRLAYSEWFGPEYRYPSLDDAVAEGQALGGRIAGLLTAGRRPDPPALDGLRFRALVAAYRRLFRAMA